MSNHARWSSCRRPGSLVVLALLGCAGGPSSHFAAEEEAGETPEPRRTAKAEAPALAKQPPPRAEPPGKSASELAAEILRDLKDPKLAEKAFLRIWEVPREAIPALIDRVEDPEPSSLERIEVLVLDPGFVSEGQHFLATRLHGLGRMETVEEVAPGDARVVSQEYTKISIGFKGRKKKKVVVLDKFGGFPVGVVIRAGLINRLRSTRYPALSDDEPGRGNLIAWWREYHRRVRAEIPPP